MATKVPNTNLYAFSDSNIKSATLYVPASALESYKATAPWSSFGTILAVKEDTGVEGVAADKGADRDGKFLENGRIAIMRNGVKYNAGGLLLR